MSVCFSEVTGVPRALYICMFYPSQVLEVLWDLAHLPTLPTTLVQQALEEHLTILSDAYAVKETVKKSYIIKCIEDIKKVSCRDFIRFHMLLACAQQSYHMHLHISTC